MIISLTGFMGCGKSSVGRELSQLLCCPFMDLDQVIEEREGRSIPEIFASEGEEAFRAMELGTLKEIVGLPMYSRGPLEPATAGCSQQKPTGLFVNRSRSLAGGGKMPLPYNRQTDKRPHNIIQFKESASLVLALGGGTVMTAECAEIVHSDTICIYLRASVNTLMEHLSGQTDNRPLLSQKHSLNEISTRHCEESEGRRGNLELETRIKELMAIRSDTYEKTAHIIIDTDGKSIEAVASEIISIIREELV